MLVNTDINQLVLIIQRNKHVVNTLRERHFESAQPDGSEAPIPTIVPVNLTNESGKFISQDKFCGMYMNRNIYYSHSYFCSAASSPSNLILNLIPIE